MQLSPVAIKSILLALLLAGLAGLYGIAQGYHAERAQIRQNAVTLTPGCQAKLDGYNLKPGDYYISPYIERKTGQQVLKQGYSPEDVRAIQRGCNIIDDLQGQHAADNRQERWNSTRFVRGNQTSCDHCHQGIGDKQSPDGTPQVGSLSLGASWVMADMYDRFTGILLPYELRQMQCYINSSNGFKPNIADDLVSDVTAYSRFLSAALDLRIGNRYPEQGIDEVTASMTDKRGDDYVRGQSLFRDKCAACHGQQGLGTVVDNQVLAPAVAGPNAFNLQSRNNFSFVSTILPGFICRNMPLGQEGTLEPQECRDIAFYISNLPRPAGDKQGPLAAAWQQLMMLVMPPLVAAVENLHANKP
ncbi:c-type cytochrome [Marinobacterium rhizophilum]|uniref:C-type cytochrome n=1 Tax=Marinobacterium rhizophilum TaxID=420402 RepID=A0ABY5HJB4_9GAMM|nr:c-type cytochrome [Marinobacterium rhizophilum]UTW11357.1 c-type cytochrome [Marinobacterium rhizophilum]